MPKPARRDLKGNRRERQFGEPLTNAEVEEFIRVSREGGAEVVAFDNWGEMLNNQVIENGAFVSATHDGISTTEEGRQYISRQVLWEDAEGHLHSDITRVSELGRLWDYKGISERVDRLETSFRNARSVSGINSIAQALRRQDSIITAEINRVREGTESGDINALMTLRRRVRQLKRQARL